MCFKGDGGCLCREVKRHIRFCDVEEDTGELLFSTVRMCPMIVLKASCASLRKALEYVLKFDNRFLFTPIRSLMGKYMLQDSSEARFGK
jgi:hypothetical protein